MNREEKRFIDFLKSLNAGDRFHVMPRVEAEKIEGLQYLSIPGSDNVSVLLNSKNIKILMDAGYEKIDAYVIGEGGNK